MSEIFTEEFYIGVTIGLIVCFILVILFIFAALKTRKETYSAFNNYKTRQWKPEEITLELKKIERELKRRPSYEQGSTALPLQAILHRTIGGNPDEYSIFSFEQLHQIKDFLEEKIKAPLPPPSQKVLTKHEQTIKALEDAGKQLTAFAKTFEQSRSFIKQKKNEWIPEFGQEAADSMAEQLEQKFLQSIGHL